jgi:hypothetical protein
LLRPKRKTTIKSEVEVIEMNSKNFLQIGGAVLVLLGLLGFLGVIGPTPDRSLFGEAWWFDNGENWAHLVLGVVGLLAAYMLDGAMQRNLVLLLAIVALFFGIYGFVTPVFLGANLESPADNILHLVVAVWAFLSWKGKEA